MELALLLLSLAAAGAYGYGKATSGKRPYEGADDLTSHMDAETRQIWNSLTASQREAIINKYYTANNSFENLLGIFGDRLVVDEERLLADLAEFEEMRDDYAALGDAPVLSDYLDDARGIVDAENAEMFADLDKLLNTQTDLYNNQLRNLSDDYTFARNSLMTNQFRQNAQVLDSFQNNLDRSRRNALENGASAGIRLADNINALLTVQNKQASTSMETANQLAQMMINQRNAENSIRNDYSKLLREDTANRHSIKLSSEDRATSLANTNYSSAADSYAAKEQKLDQKYSIDNPLYDYRKHSTSKY